MYKHLLFRFAFLEGGWEIVYRYDTIKTCIYGGLVHFAGRGVGKKYLPICRRQPILFVNACRFLFCDCV